MQVNRSQPAPAAYGRPAPHDLIEQLAALDDLDDPASEVLLQRHRACLFERDRFGNTVLHLAASMRNRSTIVRALHKAGADPMAVNLHGDTALHIAVSRADGDPEVVSALLSAGGLRLADLHDRQGRTALDRARQYGTAEVVDRLIADLHLLERCVSWRDDAHGAAWCRLIEALDDAPLYQIQDSVTYLGGVNAADPRGMPVLIRAADAGRMDVAAWLLEEGAQPNAVFRSHRTGIACSALMVALPYPAVTRLLLAWGANPMETHCAASSWWGRSLGVLHVAAMTAAPESMTALLTTRPRKAWADADLAAALLTTLRDNRPDAAFALLEYTGTLDRRSMQQAFPLAVRSGNHELVQLMLAMNANAYLDRPTLREAIGMAVDRRDGAMGELLAIHYAELRANRRKGLDGCVVQ